MFGGWGGRSESKCWHCWYFGGGCRVLSQNADKLTLWRERVWELKHRANIAVKYLNFFLVQHAVQSVQSHASMDINSVLYHSRCYHNVCWVLLMRGVTLCIVLVTGCHISQVVFCIPHICLITIFPTRGEEVCQHWFYLILNGSGIIAGYSLVAKNTKHMCMLVCLIPSLQTCVVLFNWPRIVWSNLRMANSDRRAEVWMDRQT